MKKCSLLFVSYKHLPSTGGMEVQNTRLLMGIRDEFITDTIIIKHEQSIASFLVNIRSIVRKALRNESYDIIYINDGVLAFVLADLKKDFPMTKFIFTAHGLEISFPLRFYQNLLAKRLKQYDLIIAVSRYTQSLLHQRGIDPERIIVISNGCEPPKTPEINEEELNKKFESFINKTIVVSIGRAVKRKGFSWFAKEVLPLLPEDVVYVIIGPLAKVSFIRKCLAVCFNEQTLDFLDLTIGYPSDSNILRQVVSNRFFHVGKLSDEEMAFVLSKSKVMVVPNKDIYGDTEGFGLVAIEGGINKKWVFASELQGLTDAIIDGQNGELLTAMDAQLWAKKVSSFVCLSDQDIAEKGLKAYNYNIKHFSWDAMCKAYISAFYRTIA